MKIVAVATVLAASFLALPSWAAGNLEDGEEIAYSCLGCHGIEGYRNMYPSFRVPKLGGQKAAYLEVALKGYRDGTRSHPTMIAQAESLSDQDITDVAAYLATLGAETVEAGGSDAPQFEKAATCAACHGQNGIGASPVWPTLAGQHEDYLVHALNQYRDGTRKDAVMAPMAAPLTDEDVVVLARYFAALEGLQTTLPESE
ncbi:MAG: cytochrome c [Woeseiaceae bacterium]|nr:cytochrome c [Woeseiaceae bacterium]